MLLEINGQYSGIIIKVVFSLFVQVIDFAIDNFKKNNLDGLFIVTNAPGRSAYNRVERRMAPLSRELSGVILPHDHFGSHLDNSGKTIDDDLEIQNFAEAGKVLASIWNDVEIDKYPVVAHYISPPASDTVIHSMPAEASQEWRATHVRESQYCLQVVRCTDITCCSPWRSSLHQLLPGRFLPNPVPAKQNSEGFVSCNTESNATFLPLFVNLQLNNHVQKDEMGAFVIPPYDLHCPSVQLQLVKRCCSVCGIYHASVKSAVNHVKVHRRTSFGVIPQEIIEKKRPVRVAARRQREMMVVLRDHLNNESAEWLDVEEIDMDLQEPEQQTPAVMPVIENIQQWATNSVWEDL